MHNVNSKKYSSELPQIEGGITEMFEIEVEIDRDLESNKETDLEKKRAQIEQFYGNLHKLDAFELLGANPKNLLNEIYHKFQTFCDYFAPWQFEGKEWEKLRKKAEVLFKEGALALAQLADQKSRATLFPHENAKVKTKKNKGLDAQAQYEKGKVLSQKGNYHEGLMHFHFATESEPENALYKAELIYCLFQIQPEKAAQSLKDLRELLCLKSSCGVAWLYSGLISWKAKDAQTAVEHLKKACILLPEDPRPKAALQTLNGTFPMEPCPFV